MPLPGAEPGLIVRYDYLWSHEAKEGHQHGKDRPACLVAAITRPGQDLVAVLLPITHTPPSGEDVGIEIPAQVKHLLDLDAAQSWIIISDHNLDEWPSPGLSPLPGKPGRFAYGFIPPGLFTQVKSKFMELLRQGKTHTVQRAGPEERTGRTRGQSVRAEIAKRQGPPKPRKGR